VILGSGYVESPLVYEQWRDGVAPSKNCVADTVQPAASWPKPPDTFSRFPFR